LIFICATFVAEPLEKPLRLILGEAGLAAEVGFAPYHQVFQQLLTPGSELARNSAGIRVLLIRLEDFIRDQSNPHEAQESIDRTSRELAGALTQFAPQIKAGLIVCVLPASPFIAPPIAASIQAANSALTAVANGLPGVSILQAEVIDALDGAERHDLARDELAHIPYTDEYFAAMALALARRIHALSVPAAKVLVLDCDNTLWRGVIGEDGLDGIEITAPFRAVQQFAIALHDKGILVCLVSKNAEADVLEVFERRQDMRLKANHVVAHRINWLPKSANLASLAEEINLGLEAFVFLDDNPVECAQMRAELPQVVTVQMPADAQVESLLQNLWMFDKLVTTTEDTIRTRMYRENTARRALESTVGDIGQFMAALGLNIDIAAPSEDEWQRIEQLTQRTNQFNFTTRRQTLAQLKSMQSDGALVLRVRVSDRFGDYGLVGAIVAHREGNGVTVDNWMLSCRVLGRGVEHAMLRRLAELADASGLELVRLPYIPTARNEPARAFADSIASEFAEQGAGTTVYTIPVVDARMIEHRPGHDPIAVTEARLADEKRGAGTTAAPPAMRNRSERYTRLAVALNSGQAVMRELAANERRVRTLAAAATPPQSALETQMLGLWESLLGVDGIGIDDDYFALGGTSLLSVTLFARIHREFGVRLSLTSILEAPTVRSLAQRVAASSDSARQGLVCLRPGTQRTLFLVHDGLGETLLYLNLARRMPEGIAVYGIEPRRLPGIPLANATIEEMAAFYVDQIRKLQPRGPYLLGGMCAGGVIAYEMAACLSRAGEPVQIVTILDGATPQAVKRTGRMTRARLSRLHETVAAHRGGGESALSRWTAIAAQVAHKVVSVIRYESRTLVGKISTRFRFALMQRLLATGGAWPKALPELTVQQIYNELEARYAPPALADVPVLLVRASAGDAADTPFREVYLDEDFGWRRVARRLELVDVTGGHSSMLQENYVESLASALLLHMPAAFDRASGLET